MQERRDETGVGATREGGDDDDGDDGNDEDDESKMTVMITTTTTMDDGDDAGIDTSEIDSKVILMGHEIVKLL